MNLRLDNYKTFVIVCTVKNHDNFYSYLINHFSEIGLVSLFVFEDIKLNIFKDNILTFNTFKRTHDYILVNKAIENAKDSVLVIDEIFGFWFPVKWKGLIKQNYILIVHNCFKISSFNFHNPVHFYDSVIRKKVVKNANAIITISTFTKKFLINNNINKNVFVFPFSLRKNNSSVDIIKNRIGIIGSLTSRKNIKLLNEVIEKYKNFEKITFFVIGNLTSSVKDFKYNSLIDGLFHNPSDIELDNEILKCDILLCLTPIYIQKNGIREFYGVSKDSGVFFDAYRNNKLVLAPDIYRNTWYSSNCVFFSNSSELFKHITNRSWENIQHQTILDSNGLIDDIFKKELENLTIFINTLPCFKNIRSEN